MSASLGERVNSFTSSSFSMLLMWLLRDCWEMIQALGGPGDVQLLRHKQEILQVQKIHRGSFRKLHDILRFLVGSLPVYHNEKVVATISKNLLFGT